MAQKDQELIFERAPYVDLVVGPGQLHQVPELIDEDRSRRRASSWKSASAARTARRDEIERSFESYDPLRDPAMRPTPFPGVRADHDRLRQVLHLLHRAQRPRPRAEPAAASTSSPRPGNSPTKAARKSRCSARRSTATATAKATAPRG